MAGESELEIAKGLKFSARNGKIRIDQTDKRLCLMGNQESIIIPDLKKGQKITVMGKTLKGNCGFSVSENATGSSGWENTTTNQTNIATVNSDGDVTISCTLVEGGSGMGITSVSVTGIDGETVLTKAQYLEEISAPTINYDPTTHEVNIVSGSSDADSEVTTYYTLTGRV